MGVVLYLGLWRVLRPQDRVPAVRDHLRGGHRHLRGVWFRDGVSHVHLACTCLARPARRNLATPSPLLSLLLLGAGAVSAVAVLPARRAAGPPARGHPGGRRRRIVRCRHRRWSRGGRAATSVRGRRWRSWRRWLAQQPKAIVPVDAGGAAVVVVKFHDFQCPPCKQAYLEYKPIFQKYATQAPGKVKLRGQALPDRPGMQRQHAAGGSTRRPARRRRPS